MTVHLEKPSAHKRVQVAASLRSLAAALSPGDRLPSVSALERQFGVATGTVEAAVRLLRREGVVVSRPGSGLFVAGPRRTPLRTERGTLAVLTLASNAYFRHCVSALTAHAEAEGLRVFCHYGNGSVTLEDALDMQALQPVGYLLSNYQIAPLAEDLVARGHRAVVIGAPPAEASPTVPCVWGDHDHGATLAVRHLLDQGHRRIAFAHTISTDDLLARRRWVSHQRALREAGLESDARISPTTLADWRRDTDAVRRFFAAPDAPTALVCWNDTNAIELLSLLPRAGVRVPEDVSLIGYDNDPLSRHSRPALDTVDQHVAAQVRHALSLLCAPPADGPQTVVVPPTLLPRKSCGRPAGTDGFGSSNL